MVEIFGEDQRFKTVVLDDCSAYFPLVGVMKVCGLTVDRLSDTLSRLLEPYFKLPVIVYLATVKEPTVIVLGEVRTPGALKYTKGMTLGDALYISGLLPSADIQRVEVNGKRYDLRRDNPRLKPGDRIFVPRNPWVSLREWLTFAMSGASFAILLYNTFFRR